MSDVVAFVFVFVFVWWYNIDVPGRVLRRQAARHRVQVVAEPRGVWGAVEGVVCVGGVLSGVVGALSAATGGRYGPRESAALTVDGAPALADDGRAPALATPAYPRHAEPREEARCGYRC